jgi:hypothetical protein
MKIKGNGCSALILAAGLWVCFAAPSPAAAGNDATAASPTAGAPIALNKYTRHSSRHWRTYAHHRSSKEALKSTDDKQAAATDVAGADAGKSSTPPPSSSEIPPSVANANAQLAASDSPTSDAAQAMSVRANNIVQSAPNNPADARPASESQVVAADQLNDVDRALHEASPPAAALPLAVASAEPTAASAAAAPVVAGSAASSSDSTWDKTSLIGKIFIGFGALLTMASAARMFMA